MKTASLLLTLTACLGLLNLQAQIPTCHDVSAGLAAQTPTEAFASLASEADFREAHLLPAVSVREGLEGRMIEFAVEGGDPAQGYLVSSTPEPTHLLIMIHEWWGLNDHIKQEAERFASALGKVGVLAVDLYDGKVATNREAAAGLMESAKEPRVRAILQAAMNVA